VQYLYFRYGSGFSAGSSRAAIWNADGDLIAQSPCSSTDLTGLVRFDFSSAISITAGTDYYLGILSDDTGWQMIFVTGAGAVFREGNVSGCTNASDPVDESAYRTWSASLPIWMSNDNTEDGS
jgi:hypothetical protein